MGKRLLIATVVVLLVAGVGWASEKAKAKGHEGSWVGWVTDTKCGAKGGNEAHAACAKKCVAGGAQYALYTPADGKVYVLNPQEQAAAHAGHHVKVKGSLEGDTLTAASIEMTGEQKGLTEKEKQKERPKPRE